VQPDSGDRSVEGEKSSPGTNANSCAFRQNSAFSSGALVFIAYRRPKLAFAFRRIVPCRNPKIAEKWL